MEIVKSGLSLGAEVKDLDLKKDLSNIDIKNINEAWDENLVLFFKNQNLSDPDLIKFSKNFGNLDLPNTNPYGINFSPEYPEINVISNVKKNGKPTGILGDGEATWHADMTYRDIPPKAAILYSLEVPKDQGDTHFANMIAAYEDMPQNLKQKIENKTLIHDSSHNSAGQLRKGFEEISDPSQTPGAKHPIVFKDPDTGKKSLFIGRRPYAYILGMKVSDSEKLLDEIWAHATQDKYTWTKRWEVNELLMWKNLFVLHKRDSFDPNTRRIMHRTQVAGETKISA